MPSFKSLLLCSILACTATAATAAPKQSDSPVGSYAIAKFPSGGSDKVSGYIKFESTPNGQVAVSLDFEGLPSSGYPFLYHIHTNRVPESGNCTAALGHLNPFNASTPCNLTEGAQYCEIGDLSGKWGKFNTSSFETSYIDPYLSLNKDSEAYFGDRSVVIHFANTSRIACANLAYISNSSAISPNSSSSGVSTAVDDVSTAGANTLAAGGAIAVVAGLLAMVI